MIQSRLQWKGGGMYLLYADIKILFHIDVHMYTHTKKGYVSGQSHHDATDLQKSNIQSFENLGIIKLGISCPHRCLKDSSQIMLI